MSTRTPCAGKHVLFDSTDISDHLTAARICAACPLINTCRQRLTELQANAPFYGHPEGTWAGLLLTDGNTRNRVRRLARQSQAERMAAEEANYTDASARQAHTAFAHGDQSEWARTGERIYRRRQKRGQRDAQLGVAS
jgi:hypothetical protein